MKYKIIILVLLISSCSYGFLTNGEFTTLLEIQGYVYNNIDYLLDSNGDYFQSPKETYDLGTGDCEDHTIMFMFLANRDLCIKPSMQIVFIENRGYHALAYYNDVYYDPTNNYIFTNLPLDWHKIIRWDYDIIMIYSTKLYTKGDHTWQN